MKESAEKEMETITEKTNEDIGNMKKKTEANKQGIRVSRSSLSVWSILLPHAGLF